jgi:GNAT superfamily N-acetyltransferase
MSQPLPSIPKIEVTHVTSNDDFFAIVGVEGQAFTSSALMALMFPPPASSEPGQGPTLNAQNHQVAWSTDATTRYLKACLPDGTIVGFAKWNFFLENVSEPQHPWQMELPPNTNKELSEYYFGSLDKVRNEAMKGKRHFLMAILAVLPEYQRIGVGGKLLEWGLQEADREGVECWIDSSPFGLGLYKKFGWKEVGYLDVDLGRWGGEEGKVRRTVDMVRQPHGKDNSRMGN